MMIPEPKPKPKRDWLKLESRSKKEAPPKRPVEPEKTDETKADTERPYKKTVILQKVPAMIQNGGESPEANVPHFRKTFLRYQAEGSLIEVLELLPGDVVRLCREEDVANAIGTWFRTFENSENAGIHYSELRSKKFCLEVAASWVMGWSDDVLTELPPAIRFKSEPGLCFSRLPFDLRPGAKLEEAPTWAECFSRMTNSEAFAMRIGSLFDKDADRKQAVWLWGPSDNGKSLMLETIGKLFGNAFSPMQYSDTRGEFFMRTLVGKRVAYVNECDLDFLMNKQSRFKGITGETRHLINRKGKDHFAADLEVVMFMSSNPEPAPNDLAVVNRLIVCHVEPVAEGAKRPKKFMEAKLFGELEAFLSWAYGLYLKKNLSNGRIPSDQTRLLERLEHHQARPWDFLYANFAFEEGKTVLSDRMEEVMKMRGVWKSNNVYGDWKDAWAAGDDQGRRVVTKRERSKQNGRHMVLKGIREKRDGEREIGFEPRE